MRTYSSIPDDIVALKRGRLRVGATIVRPDVTR